MIKKLRNKSLKYIIHETVNRLYYFLVLYLKHRNSGIKISNIRTYGLPIIETLGTGKIIQKGKLTMVNTAKKATLGSPRRCKLLVYDAATLSIEGNVYMSNAVIVATKKIDIGNNVMIGGGVTIVDSDFHTMDFKYWGTPMDEMLMKRSPVKIGNNVFIGMNSIILKGVNIGNGAVVAAGSVVNTDIPANEIWGGNPARFINKRRCYSTDN